MGGGWGAESSDFRPRMPGSLVFNRPMGLLKAKVSGIQGINSKLLAGHQGCAKCPVPVPG